MNNEGIYKFLFPRECVIYRRPTSKLSFGKMTSAIKDKILETFGQDASPKKGDSRSFDQYIPKFYYATLKDSEGDKRYMTVCNLFLNVANGNIEDSVLINDIDKSFENPNQFICSSSLCLVSDQPIFQFQ